MVAQLRGILLLGFWFTSIALVAPFVIALRLLTGNENMIYKPVGVFVRLGLRMVGVRVEVRGQERLAPGQTYILTPNHQSLLEVPMFVTYLGRNVAYLAKKELFKYPIWGFGIRLMGVIPIDRSNTAAAVESARGALGRLRGGKSYIIYPEGTRSPDGRLLPFKKGAFVLAVEAGVPVVPVSVSGCAAIMPKAGIKIYPATVRITLHDPIDTTHYSKENIGELMALTRERILSALPEAQLVMRDA